MRKKTLNEYFTSKGISREKTIVETSGENNVTESTLKEILVALKELSVRIKSLEDRLYKIEEELKRLGSGERRRRPAREEAGSRRIMEIVMDKLNKQGYITASRDLLGVSNKEEVMQRLKRLGCVEISIGDDMLIVHPRVYRELTEKLKVISDQDPIEAMEKMGEAKNLFNELVRRGYLFFDFKKKRWVKA